MKIVTESEHLDVTNIANYQDISNINNVLIKIDHDYNDYTLSTQNIPEAENILEMYDDTKDIYFNYLLCKCVQLYTYKFDKCLVPFIRNNFNIPSDDIIKAYNEALSIEDDHSIISLSFLDTNIRTSDIGDNIITNDKILIAGDDVIKLYERDDIKPEHKIGRILYNMFLVMSSGFISCPQPIILYVGMTYEAYTLNFAKFKFKFKNEGGVESKNKNKTILVTKRLLSSSLRCSTSLSFAKCIPHDKNGIAILMRIFVHQGAQILPVRRVCQSQSISNEYEIILNYAESFTIMNDDDSAYVLTNSTYRKQCIGETNAFVKSLVSQHDESIHHTTYFLERKDDDEFSERGDHPIILILVNIINNTYGHLLNPKHIVANQTYILTPISLLDMRFSKLDEIESAK